jgi:hypothetical protein
MAIKPMRLADSTCAIAFSDSAIDWDSFSEEKKDEYGRTRPRNPACFRSLVPVKAGEQLTVFEIGVVPVDILVKISDECPPRIITHQDGSETRSLSDEMLLRCFLAGVRDISPWPSAVEKRKVGDVEYVDPKWLKENFCRGNVSVVMDIGAQIYRWNLLTENESKN